MIVIGSGHGFGPVSIVAIFGLPNLFPCSTVCRSTRPQRFAGGYSGAVSLTTFRDASEGRFCAEQEQASARNRQNFAFMVVSIEPLRWLVSTEVIAIVASPALRKFRPEGERSPKFRNADNPFTNGIS